MPHKTLARLRAVRVRITAIATVITGVTLTVFAVLLVTTVENRLEAQVRADSERAAHNVVVALEAGQPFEKAVSAPMPGTFVYIVGGKGTVLAATPGIAAGGMTAIGPLPDVKLLNGQGPVEITQQFVSSGGGTVSVVAASPLADVQRSVSALSHLLWVGIPMLVGLVALLAWFLVGRALRPVDAMRREVDEISHTTLHRRVAEPTSGDEVARLAHTMNAMLNRLDGAAERQRRFVSDASHELRSPLATIRAKVEVADLHPDGADWAAVGHTVLSEIDRLDDLVGDLLQMARLDEAGGTLAPRDDVDLDEVAGAEVSRLRGLAVAVDDSGVSAARVQGDGAALGRLVRNLADNAARHASSRVGIRVGIEGREAILRVDDDGPGVPVADRERVFERFTRLDESRVRGAGGSGLGLALVRAVAVAHGGSVRVLDSPLGGARFEARLPVA
jgi:signal transduction histidine kinase